MHLGMFDSYQPLSPMPLSHRQLARAALGTITAIAIGCSDGTGPGPPQLSTQPIVFMRPSAGWDIVRINPDGTGETTLTTNPGDDTYPSWSPDRKRIAYVSSRQVGTGVYVMDADGSNQRFVFRPDFGGWLHTSEPTWAPDQQWLAYVKGLSLIRVRLDGTGERVLGDGYAPSWSPDGQRIVFVWNRGIMVSNADGSDRRPVATGLDPAWSPDGQRIAYAAGVPDTTFIYTVNVDGTDVRRITTEMTNSPTTGDLSPVWSPDGRWIAFQRAYRLGCVNPLFCVATSDIFVTRSDGTDLRKVTTDGKSVRPSW